MRRRLLLSIAFLFAVVVIGMLGYVVIEGWPFLDTLVSGGVEFSLEEVVVDPKSA